MDTSKDWLKLEKWWIMLYFCHLFSYLLVLRCLISGSHLLRFWLLTWQKEAFFLLTLGSLMLIYIKCNLVQIRDGDTWFLCCSNIPSNFFFRLPFMQDFNANLITRFCNYLFLSYGYLAFLKLSKLWPLLCDGIWESCSYIKLDWF